MSDVRLYFGAEGEAVLLLEAGTALFGSCVKMEGWGCGEAAPTALDRKQHIGHPCST